ncbi:hypothetical protein PMAYCL1PPCAC_04940, partial [Pristionchus mayeri]
ANRMSMRAIRANVIRNSEEIRVKHAIYLSLSGLRYSGNGIDLVRSLARRVSSTTTQHLGREALEALAAGTIALETAIVPRIAEAAVLASELALLLALVLLRLACFAAQRGSEIEASAGEVRAIPANAVTVPVSYRL